MGIYRRFNPSNNIKVMTEQMKQALDQAAKGLQWSNGQILLNKENFKPTDPAVTPLDKLVSVPIPDKLETAVKFGANWYRNNVWHPVSEKPAGVDKADRDILIVTMGPVYYGNKLQTWHIISYMTWDWVKLHAGEFDKWAYLEDLLPDNITNI